jgi:hypothetical protein
VIVSEREPNLEKYRKTNAYADLMKRHLHEFDDVGIWQVLGEDPNCGLGGSHHKPSLGFYEGTLREVLEVAVMMPGFWQWGAGGDIRKVDVIKIDEMAVHAKKIAQLNQQIEELNQQIEELQKQRTQ